MLAALAGWYVFLKGEKEDIAKDDLSRGAGEAPPISLDAGSTYENIVSSFSSFVGGVVQSEKPEGSRLMQVGKTPTAGYGFVEKDGKTKLRFVERGAGYVFDVTPETGSLERITNTLSPRTYEALVAGDHVVLRGLEEGGVVTTMLGTIMASTSGQAEPVSLKQRRLVDGIRAIAIDPSGNTLFYLIETPSGGSGVRIFWDGSGEKQLLSSVIVGWKIDVLEKGQVVLTQNAEDSVPGHAYRVENGVLKPIATDVQGLTFLSRPDSRAYLYGESAGTLSLFARVSETSSPIELPVRTIADKCTWVPSSTPDSAKATAGKKAAEDKLANLVAYCAVPQKSPPPDFLGRWYRGEVHTADAWWKVDVRANSAEPLYASANATFDVENPIIDPDGTYIAFRSASDKTLWLLRIAE